MHLNLMPSLEHMALIKAAIMLWNQEDIRELIRLNFSGLSRGEKWDEIEEEVIKKVSQLPQPDVFQKKISCIIKPIGLELLQWLVEEEGLFFFDILAPNELCWTSHGTVDGKKTAINCIKNKKIDIKNRYILACNYCLDEEIPKLWNSMLESDRRYILRQKRSQYVESDLVIYWTYFTLGEVTKWNNLIWHNSYSANQNAFRNAAEIGRKEATKYFLQKLNSCELKDSLAILLQRFLCSSYELNRFISADVWCFLLPLLDKDQEESLFKKLPWFFLRFFLEWPYQPLFMKVADRVMIYLTNSHSENILNEIVDQVIKGFKDYDYQKLFGEFWQQMPEEHKRYVVKEHINHPLLLSLLLNIKDLDNFYAILQAATAKECLRIFSNEGHTIRYDEFYSLPFITQVFMSSSSENKVQFAKDIKDGLLKNRPKDDIEKEKKIWNKLFGLLDDHVTQTNKRNIEEVESSSAKKLHSE